MRRMLPGAILFHHSFSPDIKVQVTDAETKIQVEYVNVAWKPVGSETFKNGTSTDEKGKATLTVGNLKKIHLMISCIGYDTFSDTVSTQSGKYNVKFHYIKYAGGGSLW